ncbi:MFS transporter [Methylobacterium sp. J-070]|uniref:MFS transporter n=1 Tax=Methylobacterium sp. J-070 TaxID=2836650 RepID=UPI001FBB0688|nr:MFS transporter [Methylobacterium sp. J-070]MCJ2049977.1 MFS transporter [Methylobacterium sp. J-070]
MSDTLASEPNVEALDRSAIERQTMRRVFRRTLPFVVLAYVIAHIDRSNIAVAAFQMNKDLGLSAAEYGFAAGIFFIPYCLLEIPSNLALVRYGARRWIARIMISWGLVGFLMAFCVTGPYSLYVVRFLLGAAEAGLYPGALYYLSLWFPVQYRARVFAIFGTALPISNLIGAPLAASLLELDGLLGLRGWQWVFIIESLPPLIFGYIFLKIMADKPEDADWLAPVQRAWLTRSLAEAAPVAANGRSSGWRQLLNPEVLGLSLVFAGSASATTALGLWMPQILKEFGLSNFGAATLNMFPYASACLAMLWWGAWSDRSNERFWRTVLPLLVIAVSLAATLFTGSLVTLLILLSFTLVGTYAVKGPFWALVNEWIPAGNAAGSIAQINALSNLAGFGATYLLGYIKNETGSFSQACLPLVASAFAAAITLRLLRRRRNNFAAA